MKTYVFRDRFFGVSFLLSAMMFLFLFFTSSVYAAAYIKFDGVDGEALDKGHEKWSDLQSFSQSVHRPGGGATGATRRRGTATLDDIVIVKELDKSSPTLVSSLLTGKVFPQVWLHLTRSGQGGSVLYYAYELKNVMISSYSISGDGDESPTEELHLSFSEIKVTYKESDKKTGKTGDEAEYTWNVDEGTQ